MTKPWTKKQHADAVAILLDVRYELVSGSAREYGLCAALQAAIFPDGDDGDGSERLYDWEDVLYQELTTTSRKFGRRLRSDQLWWRPGDPRRLECLDYVIAFHQERA